MRRTRIAGPIFAVGLAVIPASALAQVKLRYQAAAYADAASGGLLEPEGVACQGTRVLVADTGNGRLVEYDLVAEALIPKREIRLPELPSPAKLQLGSKGDLFVYDGRLRKVGRVSPDGAFGGYIEPAGAKGQGVLRSFAVDRSDGVHLLDAFGGRVLQLDAAGKVVREIALPAGGGSWSDLSVDVDGTVYLVDPVARRLWTASKDSTLAVPLEKDLAAEAAFPTAVLADGEGRLFVTDRTGGGILVAGRDGSFRGREGTTGWRAGLLRNPSQACVAAGGRLVVADTLNSRVQVYSVQQ